VAAQGQAAALVPPLGRMRTARKAVRQ